MGRVGSALDNAAAEAFNSTIKVEYIHRHHFRTRAEARLKIATWIEGWSGYAGDLGLSSGVSRPALDHLPGGVRGWASIYVWFGRRQATVARLSGSGIRCWMPSWSWSRLGRGPTRYWRARLI
jgi:hypothetical protein